MTSRMIKVVGVDGKAISELPLPEIFETPLRPDIIKRSVLAQQSHRVQPQGRNPMAGKRTTAESFGVGRGMSRVPRIGGGGPLSGTAAFAPGTVGGHLAFPRTTATRLRKEVNRKERSLALRSAIASTASKEMVKDRGHRFDDDVELPLIVSDEMERFSRASEARRFLLSLGVWDDIVRVERSRKIRGGKVRYAVGPLVVVGEYQGADRAFENFEGVDIVRAKDLSVELLAPGTHPGRLTIWSESAIKTIAHKPWRLEWRS